MGRKLVIFALSAVLLWPGAAWAAFPDLSALDRLLNAHVRPATVDGIRLTVVDYRAWAADPDHAEALAVLARFDTGTLASREEHLAFWINAYNLLAIQTVIDTGVTGSIKDAGSLFRPVWKREAGIAGGRTVTLDEIEHKILRPMGEPRIHMAVVCASLSCPDLRAEAYDPERLDAQLDEQTRNYLGNPTKGMRDTGTGTVTVSRIFDWFAEDFGGEEGVLRFIRTYMGDGPRRIGGYFTYDWSLNAP